MRPRLWLVFKMPWFAPASRAISRALAEYYSNRKNKVKQKVLAKEHFAGACWQRHGAWMTILLPLLDSPRMEGCWLVLAPKDAYLFLSSCLHLLDPSFVTCNPFASPQQTYNIPEQRKIILIIVIDFLTNIFDGKWLLLWSSPCCPLNSKDSTRNIRFHIWMVIIK